MTILRPIVVLLALAAPLNAATVVVVNNNGANVGLNDPAPASPVGGNNGTTLGQQRLNAVYHAAGTWGTRLHSSVSIRVLVSFFSMTPCATNQGTLASAGPGGFTRSSTFPVPNTWYPIALANAVTGSQAAGGIEVQLNVNSNIGTANCLAGLSWYHGLDGNANPASQVDLVSVILHELGHGLGFTGQMNLATGATTDNFPDLFSHFVYDNTTLMRWSQMTNEQRVASSTNTGNVVWDGTNTTANSGFLSAGKDPAGHPKLYTPSPQQPGSSVWHLDTTATPDQVMEPSYTNALHSIDVPDDLTLQVMRDLGWGAPPAVTCYTLSTAVTPAAAGTVSINAAQNCAGGFTSGRVLALRAAPLGNYAFYNWAPPSGGSLSSTTTATPAFTIGNDATATAQFIQADASSSEVIVNGGFESATATGNSAPPWTALPSGSNTIIIKNGPHPFAGVTYARLGFTNNSADSLRQTVSLPATTARALLTMRVNVTTQETTTTTAWDKLHLELFTTGGTLLRNLGFLSNLQASLSSNTAGVYFQLSPIDVGDLRGQSFELRLRAQNDFTAPTTFLIDDVSLLVSLADNFPPGASNGSVTTMEDTPVAVPFPASDPDGDPLTFIVVSPPSHGTVSGGLYTPATNYSGADSFTYQAHDGTYVSNVATMSVTITPDTSNDAPVASSASVSVAEDSSIAITLTATDADNDPLTFTIVDPPAHGTYAGGTYTPSANYSGSDSFTFKANDGTVDSNVATISITITPVNDVPVANAQSVSTNEDTALPITLTASDPDGDTLTYTIVDSPAHGTFTGGTYTPSANYSGSDSFTFKANDGTADSNVATISITITPVNDAPVANAQSVTTNEDTPLPITLTATDADGDTLTYIIVTAPTHGTFDGGTYTPAANYHGSDSLTFKANDGTTDSNVATISITITPVNDAPVVNAQSVTTNEDVALPITLTATDAEGDTLTYIVVTAPTHGTFASGTYTPTANYSGSDSFTFKANDGTADSNVATISITVTPVNDAPVANAQSLTTNEDTALPITLTATDADGDTLTYIIVTAPTHGTFASGTYTPTANYSGSDSFTFKANDGTADSNVATISITITPVNDAPVANAQSVTTNEDVALPITLTATDADGDTLTYAIVIAPTHGTFASGTYTPTANYSGSDSFTFKANDGTADSNVATIAITITPVNDAPVANPQSVTTNEDTPLPITLTATDNDGDTLTYIIVNAPTHGTFAGGTYTPAANYSGSDSFTFKANDGTADSNIATIAITITPVNDAPVANPQSVTTAACTARPITLTATDAEGSPLTYVIVTPPAHGTFAGNVYTPQNGYSGADSFTFKANDGALDSNVATISITVTANVPPALGTYPNTSLPQGGGTVVTPSAPPADDRTVTGVTVSASGPLGTLSVNATTGAVTISNAGAPGTYTVTVTVTDDCGGSVSRTFAVTVSVSGAIVSFSANAVTPTSIALAWNVVAGAADYVVTRRSATSGGFVTINVTTADGYQDTGVATQSAFLYRVIARASDGSTISTSPIDYVTTVSWTDNPLAAGVTFVKAQHLVELRAALDKLNQLAGITRTWTDASLAGTFIRAVHLQELRDAVNAFRASIAASSIAFTDPSLTGQRVKKIHLSELRRHAKSYCPSPTCE